MELFFLEGGPGMIPTALFGLVSLALSCDYLARPRPRLLPLVAGTGAAALLAGALGMVMGFKSTVTAVIRSDLAADQLPRITLAGLYESANNLVLAFALTTLVALALGVGGFRAGRSAMRVGQPTG